MTAPWAMRFLLAQPGLRNHVRFLAALLDNQVCAQPDCPAGRADMPHIHATLDQIAEKAGSHQRNLRGWRNDLAKAGVIEYEPGNGRGNPSTFWFAVPEGARTGTHLSAPRKGAPGGPVKVRPPAAKGAPAKRADLRKREHSLIPSPYKTSPSAAEREVRAWLAEAGCDDGDEIDGYAETLRERGKRNPWSYMQAMISNEDGMKLISNITGQPRVISPWEL